MRIAKLVVFGLVFVFVCSFVVFAAKGNETETAQGKEGNFGQCISDAAVIKNSCYSTVKDTLASCKASAKNMTESKPALKDCKATYKKDNKQCKLDFKSAKKECNKIKHSFMDSVKASMK